MNIVIPFRNTCGTEELQMCVKLIKKNLKLQYESIYIIGDDCEFKDEKVINILVDEQKYNKWLDSSALVQYYIEQCSDKPFILFNDDFFLTDEVYEIPYFHYTTLEERSYTTNVIDTKINKLRQSAYGLNIKRFINLLGDFNNFEVHIPIIIEHPDIMVEAIRIGKDLDCPALKRTMYMKLCKDRGIEYPLISLKNDIKFGEPLKIIQYPFFSLTDKEFDIFKDEFLRILDK